jgi:plastocyanin
MNFSVGVIAAVGVLVAIILGMIATDPEFVPQPQTIKESVEPVSVNAYIMPKNATVGSPLFIEVEFRDDDKNIVDHVNYDIFAVQDGNTLLSDIDSHRHPGKHPIHETDVLGVSPVEIQVTLQGIGHGKDITGPQGTVTSMTVTPISAKPEAKPAATDNPSESTSAMHASSMTYTIEIPAGASAPGCEKSNECYLPSSLKIGVGDTVIWKNSDTAAHTVTSGSMPEGPSGVFDSSLFMSGNTFEFTFDDAGEYPYFCMVHPWMTGSVSVE